MGHRRDRRDGPWRSIAARLSSEVGADRGRQKAMASRVGVSEATMSRFLAGSHQPRVDELVRLAADLGVPVGTLLGETATRVAEATSPYGDAFPFDVPLLRLDVAAGEPRLEVVPDGVRPYYFREEWLRRKGWNGDRNDDRFGVYRLGDQDIADSMFPTIQPRSVLLVDRRPDRLCVAPRSIWIVRVPAGGDDDPQTPLFGDQPETRLTTKRITLVDHQLVLESDNPEPRHAPRLVRCRPSERTSILEGRVVWFATEVE